MLRDNNPAGWLGAVDREFVFKKAMGMAIYCKISCKMFFFSYSVRLAGYTPDHLCYQPARSSFWRPAETGTQTYQSK